jgi:hypothetical protein
MFFTLGFQAYCTSLGINAEKLGFKGVILWDLMVTSVVDSRVLKLVI